MKALVVIHAEKTYLHGPRDTPNGLVPKIASAIGESELVYFLAAESDNPYGVKMFPEISECATKMRFIPAKKLITQFLVLGDQKIELGDYSTSLDFVSPTFSIELDIRF